MSDEPVPGGQRRIDRVLAEDHLTTVRSVSLAELRELREDAEQEEADLSYLRRLLQGRMDVLGAELDRRRREAAGDTSAGSLISDLPRILADAPRPSARGLGRHSSVEPSRVSETRRRVEQLAAGLDISDLGAKSTGELTAALAELQTAEAEVSDRRRRVHEVLDAFSAELTRRYRDGEADVNTLLAEHPPA